MAQDLMRGFLGAMALGLAMAAWPGAAQAQTAPATAAAAQSPAVGDQVRIVYGEPKNAAHRLIFERLQKRRVLEDLQEFLSPLKLPQPLTIKMEACNGVVNAYYSNQAVTICYEYVEWIHQIARKVTLSNEITLGDAIVGPFVDVLLHEVAHAIFDLLKIPIFGREEDAADQISAFVMLQFGKDVARTTIKGAAYTYLNSKNPRTRTEFADEHGAPAQRFFNYICLAYGGEPEAFKEYVDQGILPQARAEQCPREYQLVRRAFAKTILPHVDLDLMKKVQSIQWLRQSDGRK